MCISFSSSSTFSDRLSQTELNRRVKEESERLQKSFEGSKGKQEKPAESTHFDSKRPMAESFWRSRVVEDRDDGLDAAEKADRDFILGDFKDGAFDFEKNPEDPLSFGKSKSSPLHELRDAFEAGAKSSKERFQNANMPNEEKVSTPKAGRLSKFQSQQELKQFFSTVKKELSDYELLSDAKYGGKNSGMRSEYKVRVLFLAFQSNVCFLIKKKAV